ncbi:MAG: peptidylprolyl isomerase [Vicinamibacterales bacterium]
MLTALDSEDSWLAVSAAEGLARYVSRAADAAPKLLAAAGPSRSLAVRVTALTTLAAIAPQQGLNEAVALARIDNPAARTAARQALGRMGPNGNDRLTALIVEGILPAPSATRPARLVPAPKTLAEYRRLVERWIVPDYAGQAKPRAIWETPRGPIEIELYPGDAPMGVEYFVTMIESGAIVGTEFTRVVPNFVAQQRAIREDAALRDEVNRHGLTRGNLSWASAGLDTGRPGYTLGSTPQPHNEGNFTALGRVVSGMDAVDRLELGDRVTAARLKR